MSLQAIREQIDTISINLKDHDINERITLFSICKKCKNHTFWHDKNQSTGEYNSEGEWIKVYLWACSNCGFEGRVKEEEGKVVPAY